MDEKVKCSIIFWIRTSYIWQFGISVCFKHVTVVTVSIQAQSEKKNFLNHVTQFLRLTWLGLDMISFTKYGHFKVKKWLYNVSTNEFLWRRSGWWFLHQTPREGRQWYLHELIPKPKSLPYLIFLAKPTIPSPFRIVPTHLCQWPEQGGHQGVSVARTEEQNRSLHVANKGSECRSNKSW